MQQLRVQEAEEEKKTTDNNHRILGWWIAQTDHCNNNGEDAIRQRYGLKDKRYIGSFHARTLKVLKEAAM